MSHGTRAKLTKEQINRMLMDAWNGPGAARRREVKLEVTFKDLTWETLQNSDLQKRIVEQFPDLGESKLYKETRAHAQ